MLLAGGARTAAAAQTTFRQDVRPILAKHCRTCHVPGQVAPMPLLTYAYTKPWTAKIKDVVSAKKMPPVIGTSHYAVLTRGEGLKQAEIDTLVR